jgi:hypothetical protein
VELTRGARACHVSHLQGLFDPANPDQKALVQRAATAGLDIVWDQVQTMGSSFHLSLRLSRAYLDK